MANLSNRLDVLEQAARVARDRPVDLAWHAVMAVATDDELDAILRACDALMAGDDVDFADLEPALEWQRRAQRLEPQAYELVKDKVFDLDALGE